MGMPMMEVSEEEEPWILSKPALITVVVEQCVQKDSWQSGFQSKA